MRVRPHQFRARYDGRRRIWAGRRAVPVLLGREDSSRHAGTPGFTRAVACDAQYIRISACDTVSVRWRVEGIREVALTHLETRYNRSLFPSLTP
jgi:hypothetical protein